MGLNWNYESVFKMLPEIKTFEVNEDDIFLFGYPKSGTTWVQEMIWSIVNDCDFTGANVSIDERFPTLEFSGFDAASWHPNMELSEYHKASVTFVKNMKSPRLIKSHLSYKHLPDQLLTGEKKPKIIYVARNVKDVCLSMYYFVKNLMKVYDGPLENFCNFFLDDGDLALGKYWKHVLYFWERRHEQHILFIKYEEMKNDISEVIRRVSTFLKKTLTKEQEIELIKWIDIECMRTRPAVTRIDLFNEKGFIRVGKVGEHKREMSTDVISKFDVWTKEYLKDTDYEIL